MSNSSLLAACLLGSVLCAAAVAIADDAKPAAPPAKTAAPDTHCIHDTGTRLPVKPGKCSGVGRSYGADDISRTGAPTAGGAMGLLDSSVTVR